jgi:hypothetical protein
LILGPPGVGKSNLSVGIAMEAPARGYLVRYATLDDLVRGLRKADALGKLSTKLTSCNGRTFLSLTRPAICRWTARSSPPTRASRRVHRRVGQGGRPTSFGDHGPTFLDDHWHWGRVFLALPFSPPDAGDEAKSQHRGGRLAYHFPPEVVLSLATSPFLWYELENFWERVKSLRGGRPGSCGRV